MAKAQGSAVNLVVSHLTADYRLSICSGSMEDVRHERSSTGPYCLQALHRDTTGPGSIVVKIPGGCPSQDSAPGVGVRSAAAQAGVLLHRPGAVEVTMFAQVGHEYGSQQRNGAHGRHVIVEVRLHPRAAQ